MKVAGKPALALLLGKAMSKGKAPEGDAPDSSKDVGGDARSYFDEFASALKDDDTDSAFEALKGFVGACKDD